MTDPPNSHHYYPPALPLDLHPALVMFGERLCGGDAMHDLGEDPETRLLLAHLSGSGRTLPVHPSGEACAGVANRNQKGIEDVFIWRTVSSDACDRMGVHRQSA